MDHFNLKLAEITAISKNNFNYIFGYLCLGSRSIRG